MLARPLRQEEEWAGQALYAGHSRRDLEERGNSRMKDEEPGRVGGSCVEPSSLKRVATSGTYRARGRLGGMRTNGLAKGEG